MSAFPCMDTELMHCVRSCMEAEMCCNVVQQEGDELGAQGCVAEESLVKEEVVTLPDSGGLVLPLSHDRFLVGLLVVDRLSHPSSDQGPSCQNLSSTKP